MNNLQNLLEWDGDLQETAELVFPRKGFELSVTVSSMSNALNRELEKECEIIKKGPNGVITDIDNRKYINLQIFRCIEDPNLSDLQLQEKFNQGSKRPYTIIDNIFRTGEKIMIAKTIQRLSGFSASLDDMDNEIENLLNESEMT